MNIIVTGASKGIGYEIVKLFATQKSNTIYALSRNNEKLDNLKNECKQIEPNTSLITIPVDITNKEAIEKVVEDIKQNTSSIDILINNAGYLVSKSFEDFTSNDIARIFNVNVIAPTLLIQKLIPLLKKSKCAHIVNISSMGGFQGSTKFPGLAPYSASKSAIAGLTECLAEEYKESNMKFNALALGAVATEMLAEAFPGYKAPITAKNMAKYIYEFSLNGHKIFNGKILPVSSTTP